MNIWKNVAYLYGFVIFLTEFRDYIRIAHKKIAPNLRKRIAHCMFFSTFFVILKTPFYIARTFFHASTTYSSIRNKLHFPLQGGGFNATIAFSDIYTYEGGVAL